MQAENDPATMLRTFCYWRSTLINFGTNDKSFSGSFSFILYETGSDYLDWSVICESDSVINNYLSLLLPQP